MQTASIRTIRRAELSRAAFEAVIMYGLRKTTLEKIGEFAGVSKGVVLHHFKDKSTLLEAVFRRSNKVLSDSVIELYKHAETPHERLWAIVVANFYEAIFNRRVCQAWVSLISEVPHSEQCQRIQKACNARIQSNLKHELKNFLSYEEATKAAQLLGVLIDGIWMRSGSMKTAVESSSAINEMEYAIHQLLSSDTDGAIKHKQALEKMIAVARIALGSNAFQEKSMQIQR